MRLRLAAFITGIAASLLVIAAGDESASAVTIFPPQNLSNTTGLTQDPVLAVDPSGPLVVAWSDNRPGNFDIYLVKSENGGATWSSPVNISNSAAPSLHPAIFVKNGVIGLAWLEQSTSPDVMFRSSLDGGQSWGEFRSLGAANGDVRPQTGAGSDGQSVFVLWGDSVDPYAVQLSHSTTGGALFSSPIAIGGSFLGVLPSLAVTADGTGYVALVTQDDTLIYRQGATDFTVVVDKTFPGQTIGVRIRADGNAAAALMRARGDPTPLLTSLLGVDGWGDELQVSPLHTQPASFDLALSGLNQIFVWSQIDGVFGRARVGSGPMGDVFKISDDSSSHLRVVASGGTAVVTAELQSGSETQTRVVKVVDYQTTHDVDTDIANIAAANQFLDFFGFPHSNALSARPAAASGLQLLIVGLKLFDVYAARATLGHTGDTDCNGALEAFDALPVLQSLAGLSPSVQCLDSANTRCTGDAPNLADALSILKFAAGAQKLTPLPDCPANP